MHGNSLPVVILAVPDIVGDDDVDSSSTTDSSSRDTPSHSGAGAGAPPRWGESLQKSADSAEY